MNRQLLVATFLYVLSLAFLLFGLYLFLEKYDFSKSSFLLGSLMLLLMGVVLGYLLNEYILSKKFEIDKNLLHLTNEIIHELNIPLSTIQANSKLLKRTFKEHEKAILRLSRIDASTLRLERLYKELVYSIKKEIYPIEKERVRLDELIVERIESLKLLNRNEFILNLEPFTVELDKIGFEKVLENILSNAMKYSSKNEPILIDLKAKKLTIEDHGIGMDETELVKVYERYFQLDKSVKGEGIGLSLVKAYCDEAGISINISSQKEKGTRVSLDFTKTDI